MRRQPPDVPRFDSQQKTVTVTVFLVEISGDRMMLR